MSLVVYGTYDGIGWNRIGPFKLNTLLSQHVQAIIATGVPELPFRWHAYECDLLRFEPCAASRSMQYALTIDLKPHDKKVSLYRIKEVWGFSAQYWTPIALRLEGWFTDFEVEDPRAFKEAISLPPQEERSYASPVHEFLYLNHKDIKGGWNWGPVGYTNGVLLFPDALAYFIDSITSLPSD